MQFITLVGHWLGGVGGVSWSENGEGYEFCTVDNVGGGQPPSRKVFDQDNEACGCEIPASTFPGGSVPLHSLGV